MARKSKEQNDLEILKRITKGVTDWDSYYSHNIEKFKRMQKAVYLPKSLFDLKEYNFYKQSGRPTLTFNLLQREVNALTAEFSANVPHTKVRSESQNEDKQPEVDLMDKLLRTVALESRSKKAYKKAFEDMIIGGYGAFKVGTEPDRSNPFRKVVRVFESDVPTNVGWDPLANEDNKQDGSLCFDLRQMSITEFKAQYPKAKAHPQPLVGDGGFKWQTEDNIVVVNFWEKVPVDRDVTLMSDGIVVNTEDAEEYIVKQNTVILDELQKAPLTPVRPVEIVEQKTVKKHKIRFYRAVHGEILERSECSDEMLPWVQMCGPKEVIDGKEYVHGIVEWLVNAQMEYNFGANDHIYQVVTKSNAQFMGTKEMIPADQQKAWKNPQQKQGMLIYQKDEDGGRPEVLPQQNISNDSQVVIERALNSFQNISGRFNASIGQESNEKSGRAVIERQRASNLNTKNFYDRARLAMETGALGMVSLFPRIYDTERSMALVNEEGKEEVTTLNAANGSQDPVREAVYSVSVTMGDSFEVQNADNVDQLMKLGVSNPAVGALIPDLVAMNLDVKNKDKLVQRIQRNVIPEIAEQEGSKDKIVLKNAQQKAQNPLEQAQQQAAMLELKSKQLDIQKQEQDLQIDKIKAMGDRLDARIDAIAQQTTANANFMNAQTNQQKAGDDIALGNRRVQAEEDKASFELEKEIVETLRQPQQEEVK